MVIARPVVWAEAIPYPNKFGTPEFGTPESPTCRGDHRSAHAPSFRPNTSVTVKSPMLMFWVATIPLSRA